MSKYTKPAVDLIRFVLPLMALAGAGFGFLSAQPTVSLLGIVLGAVCGVALSWVLASFVPSRRTGILASTALFAVAGVLIAGPAGIVGGLIVGFVLAGCPTGFSPAATAPERRSMPHRVRCSGTTPSSSSAARSSFS
jgi:hypothetical protein